MYNKNYLLAPTAERYKSVVTLNWNHLFLLNTQQVFNHVYVVLTINKVDRNNSDLLQTIIYKPLTVCMRIVQEQFLNGVGDKFSSVNFRDICCQ